MRALNLLFLIISCSHGIFALETLSPEIKKCYRKDPDFKKALDDFLKNNQDTYCLVYWTAKNHRQEFITELIEKDMITPSVCKNSLVYLIEFKCHSDIIELFLKKGEVDINKEHRHGYGPLHQTELLPDIAQLLISYGADINEPSISRYTPLGHAVANNNKELINCFLEYNPRTNFRKSEHIHRSPIAHLIGCGIFLSSVDIKDRSLIFDLLIKAGAVIRSSHITYAEQRLKNAEPMKKVLMPWYIPEHEENMKKLTEFIKILKYEQREQKRKKRVDKLHAFIKPFKNQCKNCKKIPIKTADIMQWQEFKNLEPITKTRAPKLYQLITT